MSHVGKHWCCQDIIPDVELARKFAIVPHVEDVLADRTDGTLTKINGRKLSWVELRAFTNPRDADKFAQ